ncbi:Pnap_2097 family protein [Labrys sp. ZIDIC5]|uniref:Pnap_2097 family protein n=1 Tax=Labrys sedimenti TaxID=3106036 RepID=UPI002ACAD2D2|nr:Pnap_2097 family protein [Labrys sp. ZIDIC5]MDZ5448980.1 Pnap_2097 family protein [Labrys sp. ZIDIC5]
MLKLDDYFASEIIGYTPALASSTFEMLGVDSFDLINLRTGIEIKLGRSIPDRDWMKVRSPADIAAIVNPKAVEVAKAAAAGSKVTREYTIGMPQMALSGLSESWLFKELGDIHWELISQGLRQPSARITDEIGNRLYATFTRIAISNSDPLSAYAENEALQITGSMSRYGAGIFIGDYRGEAGGKSFTAQAMSSFSKRAASGSNKTLLKGQPDIPSDSPIVSLLEKPAFLDEYRSIRDISPKPAIFECDYQINPYHDINGVGLLYFAAYPTIADTCELRFFNQGNQWAAEHSTVARDVAYFANSDASETLKFAVLEHVKTTGGSELTSLISRQDGTPMALIRTKKKRVPAG